MSELAGDEPGTQSVGEDTAAFMRFYQQRQSDSRGLLYRLFVGWWRDKPGS